MIIIEQKKDQSTIKITNDKTYEEVLIMFQDKEDADDMIYRLLRGTMKGENE